MATYARSSDRYIAPNKLQFGVRAFKRVFRLVAFPWIFALVRKAQSHESTIFVRAYVGSTFRR